MNPVMHFEVIHTQREGNKVTGDLSLAQKQRRSKDVTEKVLETYTGSPSQGSEHPRMFRRHFAEATFPNTLRYKPVSEPVFKNLKPVLAGRFWIF